MSETERTDNISGSDNHLRLNFRISDDNLGAGSKKTRYSFNISAIKLLKQIETENRLATSEEQAILSKFTGWGEIPEAFDRNKASWSEEYNELKTLLTNDEYEAARASTLSASYTSPTVIKAIYKAIEKIGFSKGNILEPSMGIGNFFGLLPQSMNESKLYGVELDSIAGRIANQLYQNADITVSGYEKTSFPDNFFDVAVGNVPYGDYKAQDSKYDKHNFRVHDYFFAKTLDQVRPGGIVAFVTSKGTLDKANPAVRKYLGQRAELIGAIRLPNNAFMENAGTEVTTDIIFLQKRLRLKDIEPDWVHLGATEDKVPINSYFADNPQMILGKMIMEKSLFGRDDETACIPVENSSLAGQLEKAIANIHGRISENKQITNSPDETIPADPHVQNFTYTLVDGELYYREDSVMKKPEMSKTSLERAKGLVELRNSVRTLIDYQLQDFEDEEITKKQAELNDLYDNYTAKYEKINALENKKAFVDDSSYYLLSSLEYKDEQKQIRKADIFHKRTIKQKKTVTSVDTAVEALTVSMAEKACVDIPYMSSLTGSDKKQIIEELQGIIFKNPEKNELDDEFAGYETSDEYLSGNIRVKLRTAKQAAKNDVSYDVNVKALEAVMPKELTAVEIDARLGAVWVDEKYINDFMDYLLNPIHSKFDRKVEISYLAHSEKWRLYGDYSDTNNAKVNVTYGTSRMNAYKIIEETLNLRDVSVYDNLNDSEGQNRREFNIKETTLARRKQALIRQEFKDWVFKDQKRRDELVNKYNELFNNTRPREYDGSYLEFRGINQEVKLRKHQLDGIARIMLGGNTLLAHTVGAGKTYTMIAAAMESKRLGLCQKSLFVVPNHLTEQTASEFMRLYPTANILVATKDMFKAENRKKFCSRIATGDYDAVIIAHSQFEKIPISEQRQLRLLKEQINELIKSSENYTSIKRLERTKKTIEARLMKLNKTEHKDDVVSFEELGVDRIFIDEAHYYKNLHMISKMQNVIGIPQYEAQKSSDLLLKCRYMDELTGGRGTIFATGTPISNTMTELYTMMKYLQNETLAKHELNTFDAWASTFGESVTVKELAPEGNGFKERTRFAKFYNLPELMNIFKEVADIQTADALNLPVPKANFHVVTAKPSEYQKEMVGELSRRATAVYVGKAKLHEDNLLRITQDGRKTGLDQRLMNPKAPDDANSKVNMCVRNMYEIWEKTKENKLTQIMFCDLSTPKKGGAFNLYDDIKNKLIQKGIPENEIAFIHDAKTESAKDELFDKVNRGEIRVLMGSTSKLGIGANVQGKLIALHELDCPWKPAELEQREGRIIRQGNKNPEVDIYRYVTESTFDAYLYQTIENKQKFISQIMTSKHPLRTCEDADEKVLSYAEVKAICIGDERIREKMSLDVEVAKLRLLKSDYQNTLFNMENQSNKILPKEIGQSRTAISNYEADIAQVNSTTTKEFSSMIVMGKVFAGKDEKVKAGEAIIAVCKEEKDKLKRDEIEIGKYRGFRMSLSYSAYDNEYTLTLKNKGSHTITLGGSATGNMTRIENALNGITEKLEYEKNHINSLFKQAENVREELRKPFALEEELAVKSTRLAELNIQLDLDNAQIENAGMADDGNNTGDKTEEEHYKEKLKIIQEARDVLGPKSIITNPQDGWTYEGRLVAVSEHYAVQQTARRGGVIHEIEELKNNGSRIANNEIRIKYDKSKQEETVENTIEKSDSEELDI